MDESLFSFNQKLEKGSHKTEALKIIDFEIEKIEPIFVNEVSENHLKERKLYDIVKYYSNTRLFHQHGIALMAMNIGAHLKPEIARRVFFLEYTFSLREHRKLERELRPLVNSLNPSLFYHFLEKTNPYRVNVTPDSPLKYVRSFFKELIDKYKIDLLISDKYIGDVESKSLNELKHVFTIISKEEIKLALHPSKKINCYIISKELFHYPPPVESIVEDKGDFYYLSEKFVNRVIKDKDSIVKKVFRIFNKRR